MMTVQKEMMDDNVRQVDKIVFGQESMNILRFADAVIADKDLEFAGINPDILSTNGDKVTSMEDGEEYEVDTLFVLKDRSIVAFRESGAYPKMKVSEVMEKCTTRERALQMLECLKGHENTTKLFGVTRIVGYYSRTNSWNKSKVSELKDRGDGIYKFDNGHTASMERQRAIDIIPR